MGLILWGITLVIVSLVTASTSARLLEFYEEGSRSHCCVITICYLGSVCWFTFSVCSPREWGCYGPWFGSGTRVHWAVGRGTSLWPTGWCQSEPCVHTSRMWVSRGELNVQNAYSWHWIYRPTFYQPSKVFGRTCVSWEFSQSLKIRTLQPSCIMH